MASVGLPPSAEGEARFPELGPDEIYARVKATPFRPVRISTSGGERYDVRHPELIRVGRTSIMVETPCDDNPSIADKITEVPIAGIVALEDLPQRSAGKVFFRLVVLRASLTCAAAHLFLTCWMMLLGEQMDLHAARFSDDAEWIAWRSTINSLTIILLQPLGTLTAAWPLNSVLLGIVSGLIYAGVRKWLAQRCN